MARPYQKRHVASVLKLAREAELTKGTLRRWLSHAPAALQDGEQSANVQHVVDLIAQLDEAITRVCAREDARAGA